MCCAKNKKTKFITFTQSFQILSRPRKLQYVDFHSADTQLIKKKKKTSPVLQHSNCVRGRSCLDQIQQNQSHHHQPKWTLCLAMHVKCIFFVKSYKEALKPGALLMNLSARFTYLLPSNNFLVHSIPVDVFISLNEVQHL